MQQIALMQDEQYYSLRTVITDATVTIVHQLHLIQGINTTII